MKRGQLIRTGAAMAAAVACAVAAGVPAVALTDGARRPAGQADLTPRYRVAATIRLGQFPYAVAEDPLTDTTYVAEQNAKAATTAVINDHTGKVVARLPVFSYVFAFDSRTDAFYVPVFGAVGVVVIAGRTHRVIARLPVAASDITVDPRTGHVYLAGRRGSTSSILVLSDRTNKIIARIRLPASTSIASMAASPARGVMYAGISTRGEVPAVWVIGTRSGKILAKISLAAQVYGVDNQVDGFAVDERNNVLGVLGPLSLTLIDGQTHQVRAVVDLTGGVSAGNTDAEAVSPGTRTVYASAECGGGWISAVSERTGHIVATRTDNGNGLFRSLGVDRSRDVLFAVDYGSNVVLVINTRTNKVISTLAVGVRPDALAVNPVTGRAYVANFASKTVSVLAPIGVSAGPAPAPAGVGLRASAGPAGHSRRGVCG